MRTTKDDKLPYTPNEIMSVGASNVMAAMSAVKIGRASCRERVSSLG